MRPSSKPRLGIFDLPSDGPDSRGRELEEERRAYPGPGADADPAAHPADELAADVEPEPGAARNLSLMRIRAVELLEDRLLLRKRDPDPLVLDLDADGRLRTRRGDLHLAAVGRVLDSVVDQVDEHLLDAVAVPDGCCGAVTVAGRGQRDRLRQLLAHR